MTAITGARNAPVLPCAEHLTLPRRSKLELGSRLRPRLELTDWSALAHAVDSFEDEVRIAIVGKYTGLADAYLSIIKVRPTPFYVRCQVSGKL